MGNIYMIQSALTSGSGSDLTYYAIDIASGQGALPKGRLQIYPKKSWDENNNLNQRWYFTAAAGLNDGMGQGYFFIQTQLNDDVIDLSEGDKTVPANGAWLTTNTINSGKDNGSTILNQVWESVPTGQDGYIMLQSPYSGLDRRPLTIDIHGGGSPMKSETGLDGYQSKQNLHPPVDYLNQVWIIVGDAQQPILPFISLEPAGIDAISIIAYGFYPTLRTNIEVTFSRSDGGFNNTTIIEFYVDLSGCFTTTYSIPAAAVNGPSINAQIDVRITQFNNSFQPTPPQAGAGAVWNPQKGIVALN